MEKAIIRCEALNFFTVQAVDRILGEQQPFDDF